MIKVGVSPFIVVERIKMSATNATTIPIIYILYVIISAFANPNAVTKPPAIAVRMGSFAPHEKKGITRTVAVLSFSI